MRNIYPCMTDKQLKQLNSMKKMVSNGNRRIIHRDDRDTIEDIVAIGVTLDEAWNNILKINKSEYIFDSRPFYSKSGKDDALCFIKEINGFNVYIKMYIEHDSNGKPYTALLSFHINHK